MENPVRKDGIFFEFRNILFRKPQKKYNNL